MNSTSFGERGGKVALVDGGRVRVGWPGAPGCTTTGVAGPDCCALTGNDKRPVTVRIGRSRRPTGSSIIDGSLSLELNRRDFIDVDWPALKLHLTTTPEAYTNLQPSI